MILNYMSKLTMQDLDFHIENLRAQLQFFQEALDKTDHKAPDWHATDLVSLRNKTGRLQDDMQSFRDRLDIGDPRRQRVGRLRKWRTDCKAHKGQTSSKRLSLEGTKPPRCSSSPITAPAQCSRPPPSTEKPTSPLPQSPQVHQEYTGQHIDVTEEVNRRLRESRLRRLMESPSTSQKRKYDAIEDVGMEIGGATQEDLQRTPTKRLKAVGSFEPTMKVKHNGRVRDDLGQASNDRMDIKRRRLWPGRA